MPLNNNQSLLTRSGCTNNGVHLIVPTNQVVKAIFLKVDMVFFQFFQYVTLLFGKLGTL